VVMRLLFHDQRGLLAVVGIGSEILLHQTFSRDYEREADETGWKYLVAANIDPSGFIDCLKKLKKDIDQQGLAQLEHSAFSSHPPTEERIQRLERKWKKLKHQTGFVDLSKPEP